MVVSVICRSFLQNIKKINFDSVRDGGHFTGLPFLLTTRQEQAGAELSGLLRERLKNWINYFRGIFREGGTPPHWDLEHWYVTLRPKWVFSEPNGSKIIQFDTKSDLVGPKTLQRFIFCI